MLLASLDSAFKLFHWSKDDSVHLHDGMLICCDKCDHVDRGGWAEEEVFVLRGGGGVTVWEGGSEQRNEFGGIVFKGGQGVSFLTDET